MAREKYYDPEDWIIDYKTGQAWPRGDFLPEGWSKDYYTGAITAPKEEWHKDYYTGAVTPVNYAILGQAQQKAGPPPGAEVEPPSVTWMKKTAAAKATPTTSGRAAVKVAVSVELAWDAAEQQGKTGWMLKRGSRWFFCYASEVPGMYKVRDEKGMKVGERKARGGPTEALEWASRLVIDQLVKR